MTKGWYGNKYGHSLASRGIKVSELKHYGDQYKFYPHSNANDMYNWLVNKRNWDSNDALEFVELIIYDNVLEAKMIVDNKYSYDSTIDAFPNHDLSELSTVYYSFKDRDDKDYMNSWSRKYAFFGSVWDDPEDIKDDEWLITEQKKAVEQIGIVGVDDNPTHVQLGVVPFVNPEEVYHNMQGDNWSPLGEARQFVRRNKTHTSMSVGDIVKTPDGKYQIVAGIGFIDLEYLRKWHGLEE